MTKKTPSLIGVDLFGTLVHPPSGDELTDMLEDAGVVVKTEVHQNIANGFFPALLLGNRVDLIDELREVVLTSNFSSLEELLADPRICRKFELTPSNKELTDCLRAQSLAIEATTLSRQSISFLEQCRRNGAVLALVSDISPFWRPLIPALGLSRWFQIEVLSCATGARKRSGNTWAECVDKLGTLRSGAVMIGDSWISDVVCALKAGTEVILVGEGDRKMADLLLGDITSLIYRKEPNSIRIKPSAYEAIETYVPGLAKGLETDPLRELSETPGNGLSFSRLKGVSWEATLEDVSRALFGS